MRSPARVCLGRVPAGAPTWFGTGLKAPAGLTVLLEHDAQLVLVQLVPVGGEWLTSEIRLVG